MNTITFNEPEADPHGGQRIEDAEWGRWVIHVHSDGACTIKVYDDEPYWVYDLADPTMAPTVFPDLDAAKAKVQSEYEAAMRAEGF